MNLLPDYQFDPVKPKRFKCRCMVLNSLVKLCFVCLLGFCTPMAALVISVSIEKACPNAVTLSWIGTAGLGYNIYRSTMLLNMGTFIGSVGPTTTRATDVTAVPGQTYYYNIEAVDNSASDTSLIAATARVPYELGRPLSPTIQKIDNNSIQVSWSYFDDEDGVNIYRSTDYGTYYLVKDITSSITSSWIDNTVQAGHSYSYKITGYNECGESEASLSSITIAIPSLPDLAIDSATVRVSNDSIYGRFIVVNLGNTTVTQSFNVVVAGNSNIIASWNSSGNLLAGYYYTYNYVFKTTEFSNTIIISVDNSDLIDEENETNNIVSGTVKMALADPTPTITIAPISNPVKFGSTCTFSWSVACSTSQSQRLQLLNGTMIIKDTTVNISLRSFSWKPDITNISSELKFRVLFTNLSDNIGSAEISFSVLDSTSPSITITTPNGGEIWSVSNEYQIDWSATDNVKITKRIISFSPDSGQSWQILSDDSSNVGKFTWKTPSNCSNKSLIRIIVYDNQGNYASDVSESIFYLSGKPEFSSPDTASVNSDKYFKYLLTYNLPCTPPLKEIKIISKPDWASFKADSIFGIAPSKSSIDTVKIQLNVGKLSDTLTLIIKIINEITKTNLPMNKPDIFGLSLHKGLLFIGLNGNEEYRVVIYNLAGKQLFDNSGISIYGNKPIEINMSSGSFIVYLFEGKRSITKKITNTR